MLVRLDRGFAGPEMFELLEVERVKYVVVVAADKVLQRIGRIPSNALHE